MFDIVLNLLKGDQLPKLIAIHRRSFRNNPFNPLISEFMKTHCFPDLNNRSNLLWVPIMDHLHEIHPLAPSSWEDHHQLMITKKNKTWTFHTTNDYLNDRDNKFAAGLVSNGLPTSGLAIFHHQLWCISLHLSIARAGINYQWLLC